MLGFKYSVNAISEEKDCTIKTKNTRDNDGRWLICIGKKAGGQHVHNLLGEFDLESLQH